MDAGENKRTSLRASRSVRRRREKSSNNGALVWKISHPPQVQVEFEMTYFVVLDLKPKIHIYELYIQKSP